MEDLATIRRIKLEQCVQLATFQTDATQVMVWYDLVWYNIVECATQVKLGVYDIVWHGMIQSVTFVKIFIRMNARIYSYQQNYTNEYPNTFILIFCHERMSE